MEEKRVFNPGDFIKRNSKKGSFMIYEGNNISDTSYKKLTVVCEYDPEKYMMTSTGYDHVPNLEVGTTTKRCSCTIDTDKEDYWLSICTPEERAKAERILFHYGYEWDDEEKCMIDITSGEVVKRIVTPDNNYYGQIIKPISDAFKTILKKFCVDKNKPSYSYQQNWDGYEE